MTTLNFEAGYMHAVLFSKRRHRALATQAGSIYVPEKGIFNMELESALRLAVILSWEDCLT